MAHHLTEAGHENSRSTRRRFERILAVAVIVMLVLGGVLAARHLARVLPMSLTAGVTQVAGLLAGTPDPTSADSAASESDIMPTDEANRKYSKAASTVDFNGNGVDDYADIVTGARKDAENHPAYDSDYYQGGYPPADRGACTDSVWRAFREAGYDLKAMVDTDIAADPASYVAIAPKPDSNIDFRRTGVLDVFFTKYGQTLTTDTADVAQWQGGDIVVFQHVKHIGVISDKRDKNGTPYVIHNMAQKQRENDYFSFKKHMTVTGHYRFDASKVPQSVLKAWQ